MDLNEQEEELQFKVDNLVDTFEKAGLSIVIVCRVGDNNKMLSGVSCHESEPNILPALAKIVGCLSGSGSETAHASKVLEALSYFLSNRKRKKPH